MKLTPPNAVKKLTRIASIVWIAWLVGAASVRWQASITFDTTTNSRTDSWATTFYNYCNHEVDFYLDSWGENISAIDLKLFINTGEIELLDDPFFTVSNGNYSQLSQNPWAASQWPRIGELYYYTLLSQSPITTTDDVLGRIDFTNRFGAASTSFEFYNQELVVSNDSAQNVLSSFNTWSYDFINRPCIDDTNSPSLAWLSTYLWSTAISAGDTRINSASGLAFSINEPWFQWYTHAERQAGLSYYHNESNIYTSTSLAIDNQRWVNLTGVTVTVTKSWSIIYWPVAGNAWTLNASGNDRTWTGNYRDYDFFVESWSFSEIFGVEQPIILTVSWADRNGNTFSGSVAFNPSDDPTVTAVSPTDWQDFVSTVWTTVTFDVFDTRAWFNSWTILVALSWNEANDGWNYYSWSDLTITLIGWTEWLEWGADYRISFTPTWLLPEATTITVSISGADLVGNAISNPTYTFETRGTCTDLFCNDTLYIQIWAWIPFSYLTWIDNPFPYFDSTLTISGGNNPTFYNSGNVIWSTGIVDCGLTWYLFSGTYIYSGTNAINDFFYFNPHTNNEITFSWAETTRLHLSWEQLTIYTRLTGDITTDYCTPYTLSGTQWPVFLTWTITGSYATINVTTWFDTIDPLTVATWVAANLAIVEYSFQNIYGDTWSFSQQITCIDTVAPELTSVTYTPTASNRTSGAVVLDIEWVNFTGTFNDSWFITIISTTDWWVEPFSGTINTLWTYQTTGRVTFDDNRSGTITFLDRAGNTGTLSAEASRIDFIAPVITGSYANASGELTSPNPTNQNVTLTLTGLLTGDDVFTNNTGWDDIFRIQSFTGNAPIYVSTSSNAFLETHTLTFTQNRSGDVILVDQAGNTTTYPVEVTWIDLDAPYLTDAAYITTGTYTGDSTISTPYIGTGTEGILPSPDFIPWTSGNVQLSVTGSEWIKITYVASLSEPLPVSLIDNSGFAINRTLTFTGNFTWFIWFRDEAGTVTWAYDFGTYSGTFFIDVFRIDRVAPDLTWSNQTWLVNGVQVQSVFFNLTGNATGNTSYTEDDLFTVYAFSWAGGNTNNPSLSWFTTSTTGRTSFTAIEFIDNWSGYALTKDKAGNLAEIFIEVNTISPAITYEIIVEPQFRTANNLSTTWYIVVYDTPSLGTVLHEELVTIGDGGTGELIFNLVGGTHHILFETSQHLAHWLQSLNVTWGIVTLDFRSWAYTNALNGTTDSQYIIVGDVVKDGTNRNIVNANDYSKLVIEEALGASASSIADLNKDTFVNATDVSAVISNLNRRWFGRDGFPVTLTAWTNPQ